MLKSQIYEGLKSMGVDVSGLGLGTQGIPDPLDALRDLVVKQIRAGRFDLGKLAVRLKRGQAKRGATDGLDYVDEAQAASSMVGKAQDVADGIENLSVINYIQGSDDQ
jgi:hypothetical protein